MALVKLKAPHGATSCTHDGESYKVDKSGHVVVPHGASRVLVETHGYVQAENEHQDQEQPADELDSLSRSDLIKVFKDEGGQVQGNPNKDQLKDAIKALRAEKAAAAEAEAGEGDKEDEE